MNSHRSWNTFSPPSKIKLTCLLALANFFAAKYHQFREFEISTLGKWTNNYSLLLLFGCIHCQRTLHQLHFLIKNDAILVGTTWLYGLPSTNVSVFDNGAYLFKLEFPRHTHTQAHRFCSTGATNKESTHPFHWILLLFFIFLCAQFKHNSNKRQQDMYSCRVYYFYKCYLICRYMTAIATDHRFCSSSFIQFSCFAWIVH